MSKMITNKFQRIFYRTLAVVMVCSFLWSAGGQRVAAQEGVTPETAGVPASCLGNGQARTASDPQTGKLNFIGTDPQNAIPQAAALPDDASPETAARSYLSRCGTLFGLANQSTDLQVAQESALDGGRSVVRFQQVYRDIPVIGGELNVNLDGKKNIISINGEVLPAFSLKTQPGVDASAARTAALGSVAKKYQLQADQLAASDPELWIYNPALIGPDKGDSTLVWRMEVTAADAPIKEFVLVDAQQGYVTLSFNQIDTSWSVDQAGAAQTENTQGSSTTKVNTTKTLTLGVPNISIYSMNNTCRSNDPFCSGSGTQPLSSATLICTQANPSACNSDLDAQNAYQYSLDAYTFYAGNHGRDSINNSGMTIKSYIHYGSASPVGYPNASWDGNEMIYGEGWSSALDVVGHELTHGVTENTSGLYYYYQSGAINESFSDLWGEFIDKTYGGDLTWLLGEDIPGYPGGVRNMANPSADPFYDPDRMTSIYYYTGDSDNGGVHWNSGVNNKAVYLMTVGGTHNSIAINPLDADITASMIKVAKIYYEVQTNLLTSGSDYYDLYQALYQGCLNLVGLDGITLDNCTQVQDATLAVEMNLQPDYPTNAYNPDAALCTGGLVPSNLFYDDIESDPFNPSTGKFTSGFLAGANEWSWTTNAHAGLRSLYANDVSGITDSYVSLKDSVAIPDPVPAGGVYLHFAHSFLFEGPNYDGGVVEYSTNGGSTWIDVNSLFVNNGYNGTIDNLEEPPSNRNPLGGRSAFVGSSHGYISSRLNLATLAGASVLFRWRQGTDQTTPKLGWFLDDIQIYTCVTQTAPGAFSKAEPGDVTSQSTHPTLSWEASAGATSYEYCYYLTSGGPGSCTWTPIGAATSKRLSGLTLPGNYSWHVHAINAAGTTPSNSDTPWTFQVGPLCYTLTTHVTGSGTITTSPADPGCGPGNKYAQGTSTTLTAVPAAGKRLQSWSGSGTSGYVRTITITMTGDMDITANFANTFDDVPLNYTQTADGVTYYLYPYIEAILDNGFTNGCSGTSLSYCPNNNLRRAEMAKFLLNVVHGASYTPPNPPVSPVFTVEDWNTITPWARVWVEELYAEGLTQGCLASPLKYCPAQNTTRAEAVKFGLMMKYGTLYSPPGGTGNIYADVTSPTWWGTSWVEKAYTDGLLPPCGTDAGSGKPKFCPMDPIIRSWEAYVIIKALGLPLPY